MKKIEDNRKCQKEYKTELLRLREAVNYYTLSKEDRGQLDLESKVDSILLWNEMEKYYTETKTYSRDVEKW